MGTFSVNSADLEDFYQKCDELIESKLILADKKISNLLKTIASSKDLCKLFEYCLRDFDYKIEFLKSRQPDAKKKGKYILELPEGKDLIAFVFCLLCDFENRERDLTGYLMEFYDYDELFGSGFRDFCSKTIEPFKREVSIMCLKDQDILQQPEYNLDYEQLNIDNQDYKRINKAYQSLKKSIEKEGLLSYEDRKNYIMVADAFIDGCQKKDKKTSNVLLTALKYMCCNYRFLNNKVSAIEKIFKEIL